MTRVLIVEQNPSKAQALRVTLGEAGLTADVAATEVEARDRIRRAAPDIVLGDVEAEDQQSLDLFRRLKGDRASVRTVFVTCSHRIDPGHILRGFEAGADGFVSLDRGPDELAATLRRILARGPRAPAADGGRVSITFRGKPFTLAADREHLLEVLISTFEDLHRVNEQLRQEIDQRGRAEQEAGRVRERFDLAVAGAGDGLWDWDVRGDFVYFSPRWKAMLGYQDHELENVFRTWENLLHPDDRDRALLTIKAYFDGRLPTYELEHRLRHKDGSYRWILARGKALRDHAGKPLRMAGSHTDVTERKLMEEELRSREAQLREFNRVLMDLAVDASVQGDDFRRALRRFTATAARTLNVGRCSIWLLSQDRGALQCHDLCDAATGDHSDGLSAKAARFPDYFRALETDRIIAADDARTDPRTRELAPDFLDPLGITSVLDAPLRLRGDVVGVIGLDHVGPPRRWSQEEQNFAVSVASLISLTLEATERKRAEGEARAARDSAEAANRAKSAFLANMSHEIRTPMNAVIGMTELALDTELTPDQRDYLEMVRKSAENLLGIINEVLDFSKIEAGRIDLERVPFNLHELIGDVLGTLAPRAYQKGLELAGRVAPDVSETVAGDPGRLRQVLVNLIGNAIKFTEQGEVVVEITRAGSEEDSAAPPLIHTCFSVRDTGIGIPASKQRLIFDPFTQADNSTTRRYGGTGLGLTISSRLVELMGGSLTVDSSPGKGSTFTFTVPLGQPPRDAERPEPADWEEVRGLSVLVVDDNATNRLILEENLKRWGMRPTGVPDGAAALAALEEARLAGDAFALVILDVNMPVMDGFELAAAIQKRPGLAGATVMMLTSGGRAGDAARCRGLGVSSYLTKPVRQAELKRAIREALGGAPSEPARRDAASPEPSRSLRILLAEDNPVNQQLALRLLEKKHHTVTVASNGREAIEHSQREPFDLILMDVQMPEMDGFEAAHRIRELETGSGRRTPILAMTAYAMKGDRDRCLDAGMDDYVAKPIRSADLYAAIARLTPAPAPEPIEELKRLVDWDAALAHVGDDIDLLRDLTATFLHQLPRWREDLDRALAAGDAVGVRGAVHPLKNSLQLFGAVSAGNLASRLESMSRQGDLAGAGELKRNLEVELERLLPALQRFGSSKPVQAG